LWVIFVGEYFFGDELLSGKGFTELKGMESGMLEWWMSLFALLMLVELRYYIR
jgi:hypothetical protein